MKGKQIRGLVAAGLATATILTMTMAPSFAWMNDVPFTDGSTRQRAKDWDKYVENWDKLSSDYTNVALTPGSDATQLNLGWYSKGKATPKVRIAATTSARAKSDLEKAEIVEGTSLSFKDPEVVKNMEYQDKTYLNAKSNHNTVKEQGLEDYYSNHVTVKGLKENTRYYYQVAKGEDADGNLVWSDPERYSTRSTKSFKFFYVGDPQIGASEKKTQNDGTKLVEDKDGSKNLAARNDSFNWNATLNKAVAANPDASFIMSAGDQVNVYPGKNNGASYEAEYAGYLGAEQLRSLPVATTIGNHDSFSMQYSMHFNNPNAQERNEDSSPAGTDYFFSYGNTVFICLDTNNYNAADHENTIKKALEANKDAKWRVVMFHHDIYGSGYDHSDSDGIVMRTALTPLFDKYDIDVVLQGHDHTYSRTYQLTDDGKQHTATKDLTMDGCIKEKSEKDDATSAAKQKYLEENQVYNIESDVKSGTVVNPKGTVYMEANSATGSKFYNLLPQKQDYIAERSQTWTPSYSVIEVTGDTFTIRTYDAQTGSELGGSSAYTIKKTAKKPDTKKVVKKQSIKLYPKKKAMTVKLTKSSVATKYEIKIAMNKSFTKGVKTYTLSKKYTSKTIKKLKKGQRYYVKARTISGTTKGAYSTVKSAKVK
ncbi:MAG: metallophosphoesterase family protein [Eubacteriales bacterium]|nr:metallophosphoesterase family protein [Eubacteriales bacterium]